MSISAVLTAIYNLWKSLNPAVTAFLTIASTVTLAFEYLDTLWADVFSRLDALAVGATGAANFAPLGFFNYIFPLDTLLTFLSGYALLRLACAGIRMIKSFVPMIS